MRLEAKVSGVSRDEPEVIVPPFSVRVGAEGELFRSLFRSRLALPGQTINRYFSRIVDETLGDEGRQDY